MLKNNTGRGKIGLVVNPVAGMGGRVGLKGTDGVTTLARARALGAQPLSSARARQALASMHDLPENLIILTASGEMGEKVARSVGLKPTVFTTTGREITSACDTKKVATAFAEEGVELILFAGGDGTARDIQGVVGERVPILGIPSGVKMHSAVFATGPATAGRLAARYVSGDNNDIRLSRAEVMDIDEDAQRNNRLSARLHGYARVPYERKLIQGPKAVGRPAEEDTLGQLAGEIAGEMEPNSTYILGPGTSTHLILNHLGLEGTLLGIDVVRDKRVIVRDANEADLLPIASQNRVRIILGVVGGQGFVLGRGNQQISADVIRRVGVENIEFIAGIEKLIALGGCGLLIDTGDVELDLSFKEYVAVRTAPGNVTMIKATAV